MNHCTLRKMNTAAAILISYTVTDGDTELCPKPALATDVRASAAPVAGSAVKRVRRDKAGLFARARSLVIVKVSICI